MGIRPILTPEDVHAALDALRLAEPLPSHHPIRRFFLFQEALSRPESLGGDYGELAVWSALVEGFLLAQLSERRFPPNLQLRHDFQGKIFQQACSVLYYRYCRSDLEWSLEDMADMIGLVPRTVQRRHASGLDYFTQFLVEAEMRQRRSRWEEVLRARIPLPPADDLYGREEWLGALKKALLEIRQPILLSGEAGIGKTTVAAAVAHALLPHLDDLVWLSVSPYQALLPTLMDALGMVAEEQLRRYVSNRRVLLVVDHFEAVHLDIFAEGSPVWWMYTLVLGRDHLSHWAGVHWRVPLVEMNHARRFFERVRGEVLAEHFSTFEARGNLGRVLSQVNHLQRTPELSETEQTILAWWSFFPDLPRFVLEKLLGRVDLSPQVGQVRWGKLWQVWLLHFPTPSLAEWRVLLWHLRWEELSEVLTRDILRYARRFVPRLGIRAEWAGVLAQVQAEGAWAQTGYGEAFLRLEEARLVRLGGFYVSAYEKLSQLAQDFGALGWFDLQAFAWLEMAWIAYYQARYQVVLEALREVEAQLQRLGMVDQTDLRLLRFSAQLELGQSPLEVPVFVKDMSLRIEAHLRMGQVDEALRLAQEFVAGCEQDSALLARGLNDLARIYAMLADFPTAIGYQIQAVNLFSFWGDDLAVARALNNLGALYFQSGESGLAHEHWRRAQDMLLTLQDRWGLQTVRANLALKD